MSAENSTPGASDRGPLIVLVTAPAPPSHEVQEGVGEAFDEAFWGGKARSLARLTRLALPTPPAFVISGDLFHWLRANGPPLPTRLEDAEALAALDRARLALRDAAPPWPLGFEAALDAALDAVDTMSGTGRSGRFAVRSSAEIEDQAGTLGAGIYASLLRVPRAGVLDAIREVLGGFLTPAAWVYSAGVAPSSSAPGAPPRPGAHEPRSMGGAVLIHPFVEGDAAGTAAAAPDHPASGAGGEAPRLSVRLEVSHGHLTEVARARIEEAARTASAVHGGVEIEWVAQGDVVCFLQMRAYQPAPRPGARGGKSVAAAASAAPPGQDWAKDWAQDWTWDAAHNPAPLSAAQAGLVELVDRSCRTGLRQRVVNGYLFWKPAPEDRPQPGATSRSSSGGDARGEEIRTVFERLRLKVEAAVAALPDEPPLERALALFVGAYEPLFGLVGPACAEARGALTDFVRRWAPDHLPLLPALLADVPSVAVARREAVAAILDASTAKERQLALDAYVRRFGDESPRWDVAEPSLREAPARLVLLTAVRPPPTVGFRENEKTDPHRYRQVADALRAGLPPAAQPTFDRVLAAARDAVAIGEDDDALFARLQAVVRRALLAIGRQLAEAGSLEQAADIFSVPLDVTRAAAAQVLAPPDVPSTPSPDELRALVAAGRQAFREALATPPAVPTRIARSLVRGQGGSGGRMVGRAVHHPPALPLGPDAVLLAATLLPTELPLLTPGALVVETGHALGHVAAQARERGIPAVVGAAGAMAAIPEGALIVVDGDRGEIVLLE